MATISTDAQALASSVKAQAQIFFHDFLIGLCGEKVRSDIEESPERYVRAMLEMTSGNFEDDQKILSKQFETDDTSMIVVNNIPFTSLCEHHFLPFVGKAIVGYIPNDETKRIVGLSKIPRLVHCFAKRLQIQERLTQQIAHALEKAVKAKGVGVRIESQHMCMQCRGIRSQGTMITQSLLGKFRTDPTVRSEFISLHR